MRTHRALARILLVTTLLCSASLSRPNVAEAQAPGAPTAGEAEAEQRFKRGIELYKEGDFTQAMIELKRAYQLAPNYRVLFNIGQVQFELGEYASALQTFEKYLAEGGAGISEDKRTSVKADIEKLKLRVGRIEIVTKAQGAEVSIDDVPVGTTPLADLVLVTAGRRRVTFSYQGRTVNRVVEVAGGEVAKLEIDLDASGPAPTVTATPTAPPTGTAPPPPPGSSLVAVPWVITGALAIGTGIAWGAALSSAGELQKKRETLGITQQELTDASNGVKTVALVGDILGVATIIGLGISIGVTVSSRGSSPPKAGLVLPFTPAKDPKADPSAIAFKVGATPNGAVVTGSF